MGTAPIPPVRGPKLAMGVTNDATIYHGRINLTINAPEIKDYLEKIPSNKSKGYGKPFNEIFKEAGYDFYKIDTALFSPAEVIINELTSGDVYHVGAVNTDVTLKSFGLMK
jgi:methenyltetrahydromethanopterin cyclohydrolase